MTALRIVQKPVNGRLIIDVPKELQNETLVITCEPEIENGYFDESKLTNEGLRRLAIARKFRGVFSENGYEPTKTEWYEQ